MKLKQLTLTINFESIPEAKVSIFEECQSKPCQAACPPFKWTILSWSGEADGIIPHRASTVQLSRIQ